MICRTLCLHQDIVDLLDRYLIPVLEAGSVGLIAAEADNGRILCIKCDLCRSNGIDRLYLDHILGIPELLVIVFPKVSDRFVGDAAAGGRTDLRAAGVELIAGDPW